MRILVVEDEKKIADLLKSGLQAENYAVDIAPDGEKGIYLAQINEYDLIILDNIMPIKTGPEVCQKLRNNGLTTPILMLSVKSDSSDKVEALDQGADDYLAKPFSFDELLARIRALLRRPVHIESEILSVKDIQLDTKRCTVHQKDKEIYLTRKEFGLLEYLLRNKGIVLSRAMIMEHVWDMNADPFSNTIESHIRSLRKKIEPNKAKKIIKTVPGRGYKIQE
jgi:DNA-binding response OmpR family regulator